MHTHISYIYPKPLPYPHIIIIISYGRVNLRLVQLVVLTMILRNAAYVTIRLQYKKRWKIVMMIMSIKFEFISLLFPILIFEFHGRN